MRRMLLLLICLGLGVLWDVPTRAMQMLLLGAGSPVEAQGAPTDATYLTQTAHASLTNEQAMGALGTGIVINTATSGVQSIYGGVTCTNQFLRALSAIGASTCNAVSLTADVSGVLPSANGGRYRTLVTLGSDQTDSSGVNTYADCTGLSFAVTNGVRANFEATIWYTAAATTTGSGWAINGPSTTNMAYRSQYTLAATTITTNHATAYNIPAASNATSLTAGNVATLNGTILPSANGTVIVRFMTEVDTSAIVCKAGSTIEWW